MSKKTKTIDYEAIYNHQTIRTAENNPSFFQKLTVSPPSLRGFRVQ
jgi:hypothetical protein